MKTNDYLIVAGIAAVITGIIVYLNNKGSLTFLQPETTGESPTG